MRLVLILMLSIYVEASIAGSITCRGHIIEDDSPEPVLKSTVREKCGEPASDELYEDIYHMPNGTRIMIRYSGSEVKSIEEVSE